MTDDRFEEFLRRESAAYNEPPARVPRDEMYAAISAARAGSRKPEAGGSTAGAGRGLSRAALIGMAATLVLGVAIGRYARTDRRSAAADTPAAGGASREFASGATQRVPSSPADTNGRSSYTQAATTELARAEALLTAYGASAHDGSASASVDGQLSNWARDILSNTRLLLDSPAADDPARRRLLQDLEVVLVQMVQRSPTAGAADERSHIERSIERTHVLSRLRDALPAGHVNGI
jgi:hypothetical protein